MGKYLNEVTVPMCVKDHKGISKYRRIVQGEGNDILTLQVLGLKKSYEDQAASTFHHRREAAKPASL